MGIPMLDINYLLKRIRKTQEMGMFLVHGLRDLPGRPLEGGPYLAAKVYDEYTADVLVEALRKEAQKQLPPPIVPACRLPIAKLDLPKKAKQSIKVVAKKKAKRKVKA